MTKSEAKAIERRAKAAHKALIDLALDLRSAASRVAGTPAAIEMMEALEALNAPRDEIYAVLEMATAELTGGGCRRATERSPHGEVGLDPGTMSEASNMRKPTVGDMVHFWPTDWSAADPTDPLAAVVVSTHHHLISMVVLMVLDPDVGPWTVGGYVRHSPTPAAGFWSWR